MKKLGTDSLGRPCVEVCIDGSGYTLPFTDEEINETAVDVFIEDTCKGMSVEGKEAAKKALKTYCDYYGIDRLVKEYADEIAEKLYEEKKSEGAI